MSPHFFTQTANISRLHSPNRYIRRDIFPAAVLPNDQFEQAVSSTDLNIIGLFKEIIVVNSYLSTRISKVGTSFV